MQIRTLKKLEEKQNFLINKNLNKLVPSNLINLNNINLLL